MANPWTSFYWDSYERKTADLSVTEHGAYFLLIKHYYCNGGPIQANASRLLTVCRAFAEAEREAVQSVLDRFFIREGDYYRHERCDEELAQAAQLSEKRSLAGKSGAEKKRQKYQAKATAIATASDKQLLPHLHLQEKWVLPTDLEAYKEDWDAFEVMRKKSKKAMTNQARKNIATKLIRYRDEEGQDPGQMLQQSVTNNWSDVYPVKGRTNATQKPSYIEERVNAAVRKLQDSQETHGGISAAGVVTRSS